MSENNLGISNISTLVSFVVGIANDVKDAKADGKFTLTDAPRFVDDLFKIPSVLKSIGQVDDEWLDLTDEEADEVCALVKKELKLDDADVQGLVIAILDAILALSDVGKKVAVVVAEIKKLKDPAPDGQQ